MQGVESVAADTSENYDNTVQQWKGIFIFFYRRGDPRYFKYFTKNLGMHFKLTMPVLCTVFIISIPDTSILEFFSSQESLSHKKIINIFFITEKKKCYWILFPPGKVIWS